MVHTATRIEHVDVLIVGAGISGIGAAYYLQKEHPGRSYAILEARGATGGTWDLFRYPGIRSDSDLHTFGYEFKPWRHEDAIASADKILAYLRETVAENGIDAKIRFHHKVLGAAWSSADARWTVDVERFDGTEDTEELVQISASWIFVACCRALCCCGSMLSRTLTPRHASIDAAAPLGLPRAAWWTV